VSVDNSISRERIVASFARQGFLRSMAAQIVDVVPGRCSIELPFGDDVSQQHGYFHGGAIGALADTAGGYAAMTLVEPDQDVLTLEYKINFLRPATGQRLLAEGKVLRAGRTVIVTQVDVYAIDGERRTLCAAIQQSIMTAPTSDPSASVTRES
jgi:uncharacterized protein (TIGR00369 family)